MANPFNAFDSLDPFSSLNVFPRARPQAAFPPLDDADTESAISKLTRGTLSSLGYVGSTLDKLTGARAIRGLAAGKGREALSVLPGSDVFGLTDEADTTHMDDLLRQHLGYDPSKGNWAERNLLGPGLEIAADPGTYFGGISALTRAGKLASKAAPVAHGFQAIRQGERSLHPLVGAAEWGAQRLGLSNAARPVVQTAAAGLTEGAGRVARAANVGIRNRVPLVAPIEDTAANLASMAETGRRALFEKAAGYVPWRDVQDRYRAVKNPADIAAGLEHRTHNVNLHGVRELIGQQYGLSGDEMDRWLNRYKIGVPARGGVIGPMMPGAETALGALGDELVQIGRHTPEAIEQATGNPFSALDDPAIQYALRQKLQAPRGGSLVEAFMNAIGGRARLLPTTHGSMIRRKEALRGWEGGEPAIEELMRPELAGRAPTLAPHAIDAELIQDQLDRYHQNRGMAWRNIPAGPMSPDEFAAIQARAPEMRQWLHTLPDRNIAGAVPGAERVPFFDPDPIRTSLERLGRARDVEGSANTIYSGIGHHGRPVGTPGDVGIPELLNRVRLTNPQAMIHAATALGYDVPAELAAATAALAPGATLDPGAVLRGLLEQHAMDPMTARGFSRLLNRWQVPEELVPWLHLSDQLQNLWKTGVYSIWPGSLGRNIGSGVEENALMAGMPPDPRQYKGIMHATEGRGIQTGIPGHAGLTPMQQRNDLMARAYIQGPAITGGKQGEIAERVGLQAPRTSSQNPLAARQTIGQIVRQLSQSIRTKGWRGLGDVGTVGSELGGKAEDVMRIGEFAHLLRRGFTDEQAGRLVARTHIDYTNLSPFEKAVMKRVMPFYTYSSRNIPKQIGRAVQSPALTSAPIRLSGNLRQDEGYVPEYLRSGLAVPLPEVEPGTQRFVTALGLPLEEAFGRLKLGGSLPETIAKTGEGFLGNLDPKLRLPLEVMTGKQFFTGRNLQDLHVGNFENLITGGNENVGRVLSELIGATPASRGLSVLNRLIDPRKYTTPAGWGVAEGLPFISGLRVSDVQTEKWRAIDAKKQLERELQASQHIKEFRDYYATREARAAGEVTPAESYALRTMAALKQRAKEAAEQQRRVGVRIGG